MEATGTPQPPAGGPGQGASRRYTTISIPQPLYEDVKRAIQGSGFRSPTEFLVYVTRLSLQSGLVKDPTRVRGPPFYAPR